MPSPNLDDLPLALAGHVGYLLVRLGKHAQRLFSAEIAPLGLRPAHCDVLFALADRGAMAQVEIAGLLMIEPAHLVALLDQLALFGHVIRAPDLIDRRRRTICLTPDGTATVAKLRDAAQRVEEMLLEGLSRDERARLRQNLRLLARDADEGD